MRQIRTQLLLGSALSLFILGAPGGALAQESVKQPVSGWAVTKVEPEGGAAPYCALARKFSPDTVLTIARNSSQESSIAIDFQKATFNTGRDVSVTMDAGAGEVRNFDVKPISRSAFVLRTGQDDPFFDALSGTRSLSAKINNQSHRFVMPDIETGLRQLQNCLGVPVQNAGIPNRALEDQLDAVRADKMAQLAEAAGEIERIESEKQALLSSNREAMAAAQAEITRIQTERDRLNEELQAERAKSDETQADQSVIADLQVKLEALEAKNLSLLDGNAERQTTTNAQLDELRQENEALQARLQAERDAYQQQLRDDEGRQAGNSETAQAELAALQARLDEVTAQKQALEATQTQEMSGLQQEAQALRDLQAKLEIAEAEKQALRTSMQDRITELQKSNEALQREGGASDAMVSELRELRDENQALASRLEAERQSYQERLASADGQTDTKTQELLDQLRIAQERNEALSEALRRNDAAIQAANQGAVMTPQALQNAQAEQMELRSMLEAEKARRLRIEQILNSRAGTSATPNANQQAELSRQLTSLTQENARLRSQLSAKAGQTSDPQELAALKNALSAKDQRIASVEREREQLMRELEQERSQFRTRLRQTAGQVDDDRLVTMTDRLALLEERNEALMRSLQEARAQANNGPETSTPQNDQGQVRALQAEMRELQSILGAEKARRERLEQVLSRGIASQNGARSLPTRVQSNNDALVSDLNSRIADLERKNQDMARALEAEKRNVEAVRQQAASRVSTPTPSATPSALPSGSLDEATRQEMAAQRRVIERLTAERDSLSRSLRDVQGQSADTREAVELRQRLRAMEAHNQDMARRLSQRSEPVSQTAQSPLPVPQSRIGRESLRSSDLVEVQNALEVALAERDEYQALLQRERMRMRDVQDLKNRKATIDGDEVALNDMIRTLEEEKVKLVRALEHERAKNKTDAGAQNADAMAETQALKAERDALRAALEAEERALKEQQREVREEREEVEVALNEAEQEVDDIRQEQTVYSRRLAGSSLNKGSGSDPVSVDAKVAMQAQDVLQQKDDELAALKVENQMMANQLKDTAEQPVNADMERLQRRFQAAEQENIRLAQIVARQKQELSNRTEQPAPMAEAPAPVESNTTIEANDTDIIVAESAPKSAIQRLRERIGLRSVPANQPEATQPTEQVVVLPEEEPVVIKDASHERNAAISAQPLHVQRMELERPVESMQPIMGADGEASLDGSQMAALDASQVEQALGEDVQMPSAPMVEGPNGRVIKALLDRSGVVSPGAVQTVGHVGTSDFAAFRWDTGAVYGSAEQSRIANPYLFENFMQGYLSKTESRCSGVFDSSSGGVTYVNELPVASYDIACIMDEQSGEGAGAAIIFFVEDGLFNVVAHEGGLDQFEEAMSTRDQLTNTLIR